jgi:hypothetical protein
VATKELSLQGKQMMNPNEIEDPSARIDKSGKIEFLL